MTNKDTIIVIDTSFKGAALALARHRDGCCAIEAQAQFFPNQIAAAKLPVVLNSFLENNDESLANVSAILVNHGPGSFTGIKVGLAFVKGLSHGLVDCDIVGMSGLDALAEVHPNTDWFLPATKTQGYLAKKSANEVNTFAVEIEADKVNLVRELDKTLIRYEANSDDIFVMQGWPKLEESLRASAAFFHTEGPSIGSSRILAAMVEVFAKDRDRLATQSDLNPRYIRKSAPEEALEKKRR